MNKLAIVAMALAAALPLGSLSWAQEKPDLTAQQAPAHTLWLDALDVTKTEQDYGQPHAGKTVDGNPLTLGGAVYPHGLGTHAASQMVVDLKGAATRFETMVGVDDERRGQGSVVFQVYVDGVKKAEPEGLGEDKRRRAR